MKCKHCGKRIYIASSNGIWYHGDGSSGISTCFLNEWPHRRQATPDEGYTVGKILEKYGQES